MMRAFLALEIPDRLRDPLEDLVSDMDRPGGFKPVRAENYHVTLRFLGVVSQSFLEDLDSEIQRTLPTPGPLGLALSGVGAFPDLSYPRVVWAGVDHPDELIELQSTVDSICIEKGLEPEDHDYHPHVTLGRVKQDPSEASEPVTRWVKDHADRNLGEFEVDEVVLMESELEQDGPTYTKRWTWPI